MYFGLFATILFAYVQHGSALRCWSCSSDLTPSCFDPFNVTKIQQQGRYYQNNNYNPQYNQQYQQQQFQRNDMPMLKDCANSVGSQLYSQKNMCVKRIINIPNGLRIVTRECKTVERDQQAGTCPDRPSNTEFCEFCDYDGCNGAGGLKMAWAAALPAALLLFLRR